MGTDTDPGRREMPYHGGPGGGLLHAGGSFGGDHQRRRSRDRRGAWLRLEGALHGGDRPVLDPRGGSAPRRRIGSVGPHGVPSPGVTPGELPERFGTVTVASQ